MYIGCRPKYTYAYNIYTCIHMAHTYKGVSFLKKEQKHKNYVKKKESIYILRISLQQQPLHSDEMWRRRTWTKVKEYAFPRGWKNVTKRRHVQSKCWNKTPIVSQSRHTRSSVCSHNVCVNIHSGVDKCLRIPNLLSIRWRISGSPWQHGNSQFHLLGHWKWNVLQIEMSCPKRKDPKLSSVCFIQLPRSSPSIYTSWSKIIWWNTTPI